MKLLWVLLGVHVFAWAVLMLAVTLTWPTWVFVIGAVVYMGTVLVGILNIRVL